MSISKSIFRKAPIVVASLISIALVGCNSSKPVDPGTTPKALALGEAATTRDAVNDAWLTALNANDPTQATKVYYSFALSDVVTPVDPDNSTDWELAFSNTDVFVNPNMKSVSLTGLGSTKPFKDIVLADMPDTSQFVGSAVNYVVDDWFSYNSATHSLAMTNHVYTMLDAGGANYVKFRIDSIVGGGAPPNMGIIWISYVYQSVANSSDLSGAVQTLGLDGSSGMVYFDFSTGSAAAPANFALSLDWDFRLNNFDFEMNNELFGAGAAAAYKVYNDMTDGTNITELTVAPTQPQAYTSDKRSSAFKNWFTYTGPPLHQILSNEETYAITDGVKFYKVNIPSWYTEFDGSPKSGVFQILWEEVK